MATPLEERPPADDPLHAPRLVALGQCASGVAHDIRNLLFLVLSNLHEVRRRYPRAADSPELAAIEHAALTGASLTRKLLEFGGKQRTKAEPVDLQSWLASVRPLLLTTASGVISLQTQVDPATAPVCVDRSELELALMNLVLNSRDAVASSGVGTSITIDIRPARVGDIPASLAPAPYVVISVEDDSCGIAQNAFAHLFEPFFTTKPRGQGTGLGLAQVRSVCESAGGTAVARTAPMGGARFELFLRACAHGEHPESTAQGRGAHFPSEQRPLDASILILDDDIAIAQGTAAMLQSFGARVRCATSRAEALRALLSPSHGFDLVLCDVHIPNVASCVEFVSYMKQHWPTIPVVLLSGFVEEEAAAQLGEAPVIDKPCRPAVLLRTIQEALGRRPQ